MSQLSRRSLVTSAAALPALAVPTIVLASVDPDPIYAAIEKHRAADAAFLARCHYEEDPANRPPEIHQTPADIHQTPEMAAAVSATRAARFELANASATSLAGLVSYLECIVSESNKLDEFLFEEEEVLAFAQSLLRSTRRIAGLDEIAARSGFQRWGKRRISGRRPNGTCGYIGNLTVLGTNSLSYGITELSGRAAIGWPRR